MLDHKYNNIIILGLITALFFAALLLPFSVYGQDGYSLWIPILSEFLKSERFYLSSAVIFDGQNLSAIYGQLPFWRIFRWLKTDVITFLNLTHSIFCSVLFAHFLIILKGLKGKLHYIDIFSLFIFSVFSPVIINRAMAGHLNLLYGVLPFFVMVSLVFSKSIWTIVLGIFSIWFALSTQSYQILAYHIFYIPILFYIFSKYEHNKAKYLAWALGIISAAFLINLPQFLEMYHHATDSNNLRSIGVNNVYSYTISHPFDLVHFFITGINDFVGFRSIGLYHEINYGIGTFLILFYISSVDKRLKWITSVTAIFLFLFCMNFPIFNLISKLPVIQAFRVPQRSFMILSLFIPLWTYASFNFSIKKYDGYLYLLIISSAALFHSFEIIALICFLVCLAVLSDKSKSDIRPNIEKLILVFSIGCLISNFSPKLKRNLIDNAQYLHANQLIQQLKSKFSESELRNKTFHFESPLSGLFTYVAQANGVRTIEGYGHPPYTLVKSLSDITNSPMNSTDNNFYFSLDTPMKGKLIKYFKIDYVIYIQANALDVRKTERH